MKYQVLRRSGLDSIPQGWSRNMVGTERHYRLGNYLISFNSLVQKTVFSLIEKDNRVLYRWSKSWEGDIIGRYNGKEVTYQDFRDGFNVEIRKRKTKLGQLL